jgi:predicted nuclease of restriction endonuclease-like RecB superfamily
MLTKDMLRFSRLKGRVKPRFILVDSPALLALANELLSVYDLTSAPTRSELEESTSSLVNASEDIKLASGLNKIILDRCDFGCPIDMDYAEARHRLFQAGSTLLNRRHRYMEYREKLVQATGLPENFLEDIYADHPDNERLTAVEVLSPQELLERYNVSLVQSLLLYADAITVTVQDGDAARLRRLFKYLKFCRLLADIRRAGAGPSGKLRMTVSGPASVLDNGRKYGLQLASFFPAVCGLTYWELSAKIRLPNWDTHCELRIDQTFKLANLYRNFSAYVPEEIKMFHSLFKQKSEDWEVVGETPFLETDKGEVVFPDFSFHHKASGRIIHLELFHRWHAGQLNRRLEWLEAHPETGLALGVDRRLAAEGSELAARLEASPYFQTHGFLFRDFPGVARTTSTLDLILGKKAEG